MFKNTTIDKKYQNRILNVDDYHLDAEIDINASFLSYNLNLSSDFVKSYNAWLSINDKLYYYKSHEIFNELFLSELAHEFNLKSLDYRLATFKNETGIICESFKEKGKTYSDYDHFFENKKLKVPRSIITLSKTLSNIVSEDNKKEILNNIFRLTVFDFFCGQTDRGDTNLIFECSDKLSIAPIFDNGSSMYMPSNPKRRNEILFANYYSSFDNLYFPTDNYYNIDTVYLLDLIVNNKEFYNYLCKALDINLNSILKRTIEKYHLVVPHQDKKDLNDYFDIKKRIIYNTLTLVKQYK